MDDFFKNVLILFEILLYWKCLEKNEVYFCFGLLVFKEIFNFEFKLVMRFF